MAAVGVGSKYNCAINGVGYIVGERGYSKKDAPIFTSRFGTGEQGLSDLDVFKAWAQDDFSGGSFQDFWDDITKAQLFDNLQVNPFNKLLYTTPLKAAASAISAMRSSRLVWANYKGELFIAANGAGSVASEYGAVYKWNGVSGWTSVKTDFSKSVKGMCVLGNLLIVSTGGGGSVWTWDGTTWTNDTRYGYTLSVPFNGKTYHNGNTASADGGTFASRTAVAGATAVATALGAVGDSNLTIAAMQEYNHRLYIGKPDGLFAYDGTLVVCVLDYKNDPDTSNFGNLAAHDGYLYYTLKNKVFRFNGATVEMVRAFDRWETIAALQSMGGKLWVTTTANVTETGKGLTSGSTNHYIFDGVGWFLYNSGVVSSSLGYGLYYDATNKIVVIGYLVSAGAADNVFKYFSIASEFAAAASEVGVYTSSEFDGGFPDIDKYFDTIMVNYESMGGSDSIVVKYRTFDGQTWSSFQTLGTLNSSSTSRTLKLFESGNALSTGVFKKLQLQMTITRAAASTLAVRNFVCKYYLSPDQTWLWQLKVLCYGNTDVKLQLVDGSTETNSPAYLRDNLYSARQSDTPVGFEDIDFTTTTGTHTAGVLTINVSSTKSLRSAGYVKIEDEIIKYTGKTDTTLTGCTRGALGSSAAAHNTAGTTVNAYFRVIVKTIDLESVIAPNTDVLGQESEVTITLQEALGNA